MSSHKEEKLHKKVKTMTRHDEENHNVKHSEKKAEKIHRDFKRKK